MDKDQKIKEAMAVVDANRPNAAHTPGPWEYITKLTSSENHRGFFIRAKKQTRAGKWALAEVQPCDEDGKIGKANARLIAAAPDLLEALERLVGQCDRIRLPGKLATDAEKAAAEAIAKATGAA